MRLDRRDGLGVICECTVEEMRRKGNLLAGGYCSVALRVEEWRK